MGVAFAKSGAALVAVVAVVVVVVMVLVLLLLMLLLVYCRHGRLISTQNVMWCN